MLLFSKHDVLPRTSVGRSHFFDIAADPGPSCPGLGMAWAAITEHRDLPILDQTQVSIILGVEPLPFQFACRLCHLWYPFLKKWG